MRSLNKHNTNEIVAPTNIFIGLAYKSVVSGLSVG